VLPRERDPLPRREPERVLADQVIGAQWRRHLLRGRCARELVPLELENVCDSIRGITPLLLGREDAVGQARTIDALPRSADGSVAVSTARGVHKHDLPAISAGPRRVVAVRHALPKTRPGPRAARSDGQPLSFSA
jgi:hypothetical protein